MIEDLWINDHRELEHWKDARIPDLVAHLVDHYHLRARVEMGRLETLAEEAVLLEGGTKAEILEMRDETARFCREFRAHMTMEERTLFPYILDTALGREPGSPVALMQPLRKLLDDEHEAETTLFRRLRRLAGESLPPGGSSLQTRLLQSFRTLEKDLHGHIYLETRILFRRAF